MARLMRCVLMDGEGKYPLGTYIGVAIPDDLSEEQGIGWARDKIFGELDRYALAEAVRALHYRDKFKQEK